ncbi:unnamed protein product, partial [Urochloa humidicola]
VESRPVAPQRPTPPNPRLAAAGRRRIEKVSTAPPIFSACRALAARRVAHGRQQGAARVGPTGRASRGPAARLRGRQGASRASGVNSK